MRKINLLTGYIMNLNKYDINRNSGYTKTIMDVEVLNKSLQLIEEIYDEYLEELTDYADAGADIFLFETFNSTPEAEVAIKAAKEIGIPAWVAFVPYQDGRLLGGQSMAEVAEIGRAHV